MRKELVKKKAIVWKNLLFSSKKEKKKKEFHKKQLYFLFIATYFEYLKRILYRDKNKVDLPYFCYQNGWAIKHEALVLAYNAILKIVKKGHKQINKNFNRLKFSYK